VEESPTHFLYNPLFEPTVIDLVYILEELSLRVHHHIRLDIRGMSDHALLLSEHKIQVLYQTRHSCIHILD